MSTNPACRSDEDPQANPSSVTERRSSVGPFTERRRLITAIRVDRQFRGVMWLAEVDAPLPADAAEQLRSAARTAAPHLRRHLELGMAERTARAQRVRTLLSGDDVPHSEIEELGLTDTGEVALIAVRRSSPDSLNEQQREQLQNAIYLACQATRTWCAVTAIGGTVFCIISTAADRATHNTVLAKTLLRSCSHAVRSELHLALTESSDHFRGLPRLRRQADLILEALARHAPGSSRVMSFPAAAPTVLLDRFADAVASLGDLVSYEKLNRIHEYDSAHGSDYARTLAGYLAEHGNSVRSATLLNIHPTTLRYRLRRLTELFEIDFENADEGCSAHCCSGVGYEPRGRRPEQCIFSSWDDGGRKPAGRAACACVQSSAQCGERHL